MDERREEREFERRWGGFWVGLIRTVFEGYLGWFSLNFAALFQPFISKICDMI